MSLRAELVRRGNLLLSEPLMQMIEMIFTDDYFVVTGLAPVLKTNERTRQALSLPNKQIATQT